MHLLRQLLFTPLIIISIILHKSTCSSNVYQTILQTIQNLLKESKFDLKSKSEDLSQSERNCQKLKVSNLNAEKERREALANAHDELKILQNLKGSLIAKNAHLDQKLTTLQNEYNAAIEKEKETFENQRGDADSCRRDIASLTEAINTLDTSISADGSTAGSGGVSQIVGHLKEMKRNLMEDLKEGVSDEKTSSNDLNNQIILIREKLEKVKVKLIRTKEQIAQLEEVQSGHREDGEGKNKGASKFVEGVLNGLDCDDQNKLMTKEKDSLFSKVLNLEKILRILKGKLTEVERSSSTEAPQQTTTEAASTTSSTSAETTSEETTTDTVKSTTTATTTTTTPAPTTTTTTESPPEPTTSEATGNLIVQNDLLYDLVSDLIGDIHYLEDEIDLKMEVPEWDENDQYLSFVQNLTKISEGSSQKVMMSGIEKSAFSTHDENRQFANGRSSYIDPIILDKISKLIQNKRDDLHDFKTENSKCLLQFKKASAQLEEFTSKFDEIHAEMDLLTPRLNQLNGEIDEKKSQLVVLKSSLSEIAKRSPKSIESAVGLLKEKIKAIEDIKGLLGNENHSADMQSLMLLLDNLTADFQKEIDIAQSTQIEESEDIQADQVKIQKEYDDLSDVVNDLSIEFQKSSTRLNLLKEDSEMVKGEIDGVNVETCLTDEEVEDGIDGLKSDIENLKGAKQALEESV